MKHSRRSRTTGGRFFEGFVYVGVGVFIVALFASLNGVSVDGKKMLAQAPLPSLPAEAVVERDDESERWYRLMQHQVARVWGLMSETVSLVGQGQFWQLAQLSSATPGSFPDTGVTPVGRSGFMTSYLQPASDPAAGSLLINTPLTVDNVLFVTGVSELATTTVSGPLSGTSASLLSLNVAGTIEVAAVEATTVDTTALQADTMQTGTLGATTVETANLSVFNLATIADLVVDSQATLESLQVLGASQLVSVLISEQLGVSGLLTATGGVSTEGADIDAGEGSVFASNIINQIVAGENVVITGTRNESIISVNTDDLEGVLSLNGQSGDINLIGGTDISISG